MHVKRGTTEQLSLLGRTCLILAIGLHGSLVAQELTPQRIEVTESSAIEEQAPSAPTEPLNFSLSAAVARNREFDGRLAGLPAAILSRDFSAVAELCSDMLSQEINGFIEHGGSLQSSGNLIRGMISNLPAEGLAAYRRKLDDQAQAELNAALLAGEAESLSQIAYRFPGTLAAIRSLELRGGLLRDQGDLEQGRLLLDEVLNPSHTDLLSSQAKARWARQRLSLRKESGDSRVPPVTELLDSEVSPGIVPIWSSEHPLSPGAIATIELGHRDLRENGFSPFSPWNGLFVGEHLLTVTPQNIESRNWKTGELRWLRPVPHYGARILATLNAADNPLRSWTISQVVLFRIFGESLYSQLTTDGQRLFLIEETKSGAEFAPQKKSPAAANQVTCLDLETGEKLWSNSTLADSRAYLCSPPTVFGEELLILAEFRQNAQIYLLALDKTTGKLNRKLAVAAAARAIEGVKFSERDGRRQKLACPISIAGSKAFCPTGAGLLAAVDLLDWQVSWIYRYPRADVPRSGSGLLHPDLGLTGFQWWSGWHEIQLAIQGELVVFASPEADELALLNRVSGEVVWRIPREDALYVATIGPEEGVVLIGDNFARSHALVDGNLRWKEKLNFPVGRGVRAGQKYLLPDSEFGWTALHLKTGQMEHSQLNIDSSLVSFNRSELSTPRNFISNGVRLFELSDHGIKCLSLGEDRIAPSTPRQQLFTRLQSEEMAGALIAFRETESSLNNENDASRYVVQALEKEALSNHDLEALMGLPKTFPEIENRPELLRAWFRVSVEEALQQRQWDALGELFTQHLTQAMASGTVSERMRKYRLDGWLRSRLLNTFADLALADRQVMSRVIEQIQQARVLDNPSEVEFWREFLLETPWTIPKPTADLEHVDNWQAKLAESLAEQHLAARQNLFLDPDELPPDTPDWPRVTPEVTQSSFGSSNVYYEPIPVQRSDESPYLNMNLEIEYPGHRGVSFTGARWRNSWPAYFPESSRSLRNENDLVRGWGVGKMIVLQVGSEVYGYRPLTGEGEPGAKLLWPPRTATIDTLGDRSNQQIAFQFQSVPERQGFPKETPRRLNEYGHYTTQVGPVRARYFCLQQKGMLVTYATLSGAELWRRYDLPAEAICLGDEEQVVVLSGRRPTAQILSVADGRELRSVSFLFSVESILATSGVHALIERATPGISNGTSDRLEPLSLSWLNLSTGQTVWAREWEPRAIPFEIDARWCGVYTPGGSIEILDIATGRSVIVHDLDLPQKISKIVCSVGQWDHLLIFSSTVEDEKILNATQPNSGYRRTTVQGPIVCINRQNGQLLWKSELENTVFPLDQPVDLPVFITAGSRFPESAMDDAAPGSRIQMFNRQTGDLIYQNEALTPVAKYRVTGNIEDGVVTLVTRNVVVSARFSAEISENDTTDK